MMMIDIYKVALLRKGCIQLLLTGNHLPHPLATEQLTTDKHRKRGKKRERWKRDQLFV